MRRIVLIAALICLAVQINVLTEKETEIEKLKRQINEYKLKHKLNQERQRNTTLRIQNETVKYENHMKQAVNQSKTRLNHISEHAKYMNSVFKERYNPQIMKMKNQTNDIREVIRKQQKWVANETLKKKQAYQKKIDTAVNASIAFRKELVDLKKANLTESEYLLHKTLLESKVQIADLQAQSVR